MHKPQAQVEEFHRVMGLRIGNGYIDTEDSLGLRLKLVREEIKEFFDALTAPQKVSDNIIKEMCDLIYVCYGWAVAQGIDLEPYFDEVHRSNMTKRGGPHREDGKQLKPDTYEEPNFEHIKE